MDRLIFYALLFTAGLSACSSGKTAYRRGDYAEAVQKASTRLAQKKGWSNRGHELAMLVLQRAFVQGYNKHQEAIRRLTNAARPYRWEAIFTEYKTLQTMTDEAHRTLAIRQAAGTEPTWLAPYPTGYESQLAETRTLAAAERYALAEAAFAHRETDRYAAREAYEQYGQALNWEPNYLDATQKRLTVAPFAMLRVLVEPPTQTRELDPADTHELGQAVFAHLARNSTPAPFVHLYQPDQTEVDSDGEYRLFDGQPIAETVQYLVDRYVPYDERLTTTTQAVESNSLYKVGEKRINDSTVVDIMEKVKGVITLHTHHIEARMVVQLRAIDTQTDKVIWTDTDYITRDWTGTWETFTGDDRALNGHTLLTLTGTPPSARRLFFDLVSSAGGSVVSTVRKQYKKR
ncbi:hypothetical protein J2I47_25150 [Fibrella sp. HMF5335]|uniref:Lipoprotein n=1 Tax=Fibrella rubiginis TaxID=2817060 RepID=A0A939GNS9_9BACT|nr:hypothetical protein [Fibrella rubiginis]MBO0939857.1 hypothetical protein [Fibrella rubiginis]